VVEENMRPRTAFMASLVAGAVAAASNGAATAQSTRNGMDSDMMQGCMGQGVMRGGMGQRPNDRQAMHGDMGGGMMCPMMRSGMMQGGMMGPGMTGIGRMGGESDGLFGSRVTPMMNLSVEDARAYVSSQLERLNNKR
jgi:hypothetical protein